MVEVGGGAGPQKTDRRWERHLGLIVGGATSIIISLKLLAVANWNPTTAFGILSANGTTNVLAGTLLAVLPLLYGYTFLLLVPILWRKLRFRAPVEKTAALWLGTVPSMVLVLITPAYLLVINLVFFTLAAIFSFCGQRRHKQKPAKKKHEQAGERKGSSRFEAASITLASAVMLSYLSLATPWMPAEIVNIEGAGQQTGYVLDESDEKAIILLAHGRELRQIDAEALSGEYCQYGPYWFSSPVVSLIQGPVYPTCPD